MRGWQLFARADQLAGAGDHVVGVPLLVRDDDDGALHNVCRHRARSCCATAGVREIALPLPRLDLCAERPASERPKMDGACGFDLAGVRLPEAQVAEWRGMVFAALDPVVPFGELMDGIDARLGTRPLDHYVFHRHYQYDIACDWKACIDNYLEGYHVSHTHPELNRMLDYRDYVVEPHAGTRCNTVRLKATRRRTVTARRCMGSWARHPA